MSMMKSLSGTYTAMSVRHLNTKSPHPVANPQPPTFLCSPGKLCISALGGKHYTGLAQRSVALDILAGPLPSSSSAHGQG